MMFAMFAMYIGFAMIANMGLLPLLPHYRVSDPIQVVARVVRVVRD